MEKVREFPTVYDYRAGCLATLAFLVLIITLMYFLKVYISIVSKGWTVSRCG